MDKTMKERMQEAISTTLNAANYQVVDIRTVEGKDGDFTVISVKEATSGLVLDFYEREVLGYTEDKRIIIRAAAYERASKRATQRAAANAGQTKFDKLGV